MAATGATPRDHSNRTADRNRRLPLTPKVTSSRRGGHQTVGRAESPAVPAATPALHITPNVVVAARGDVRSTSRRRSASQVAVDMRRFRA